MKSTSRIIYCTHPDYITQNVRIDFTELFTGGAEERKGKGCHKYGGGYAGRPQLAEQLFQVLRATLHGKKPKKIFQSLSLLRKVFRFLDKYEEWCEANIDVTAKASVLTVSDITSHHLMCWKTPMPGANWLVCSSDNYSRAAKIIKQARDSLGLPMIWIPKGPKLDPLRRTEVPNEQIGKMLVNELSRRIREIWRRWKRSDALASQGRDIRKLDRVSSMSGGKPGLDGITESDVHATFRLLTDENDGVPPPLEEFLVEVGYAPPCKPHWWPVYTDDHPNAGCSVRYFDLIEGRYPVAEDIGVLMLMLLARTGWNPATAGAINITADDNWLSQYSPDFVFMFAFKDKAGAWQDTLSRKNQPTGAYQIVKRLMERTASLRLAVGVNPFLCLFSEKALRTPWLFARVKQPLNEPIIVFDPESNSLNDAMARIIRIHNDQKPPPPQLMPISIKPGDLRDIFAAAIYRKTGYSLVLTQMALGHKSARTTFQYLRSRAWREESERSKNALVVAVFDQIEVHQKLDLTLIRAQMDGIKYTEADIKRLEAYRKNRTYSGTGCSDSTHPPAYIDPENPRDGTALCAQGHRCAGCPKAVVFEESMSKLARRVAELEWLHAQLPGVTFETSSERDDLEVCRATLRQWPAQKVEAEVRYWAERIAAGTHQPIRFSGEH